jgi:undecaprenyl-diphosphatase
VKWKDVGIFFLMMLLFWVASAVLLATKGYHGGFKWVNQWRPEALGYASLYFLTHLGDGVILPMMLVLFMWRKSPSLVITGVTAMLLTGLVTQVLKILFFHEWMRPPAVFEHDPSVVIFHPKPIKRHSFPSGHATSIASGGVIFAYLWARKWPWMQVVVGLFTVLLCYTRVVLGVHFPGDIFVGSLIGSFGSLLLLFWLYPVLHRFEMKWALAQRKRLAITVMLLAVALGTFQYFHLMGKI